MPDLGQDGDGGRRPPPDRPGRARAHRPGPPVDTGPRLVDRRDRERVELARILGFDAASATPILETVAGAPVYTLYDGTGLTSDARQGVLSLVRKSGGATIVQTDLTRELSPVNGFVVTATSADGFAPTTLLEAGGCFHDEPVELLLTLTLQRQLGIVRDSSGVFVPDIARAVIETRVQVRPSALYR